MAGLNYGHSYQTKRAVQNRKEGVTEYDGKFIVRVPSSKTKNAIKTVGKYDTFEEAAEVYRESKKVYLDTINKNKKKK